MEKHKDNYCVILAGGKGRRLWPCSREAMPKQFLDFFGTGRTQLQSTYDRFAKIVPQENILVCTTISYGALVKEQLPEVDERNILLEPVNRNTAPCVGWAVAEILNRCETANVIVSPSDQFVLNEQAFADNVMRGFNFTATHGGLLVLGVKPTRPEPGYGYIQTGEPSDAQGVFGVKSFTEKPEREFARLFMESGEFHWNTGLFLATARKFYTNFIRLFRDAHREISLPEDRTPQETLNFIYEHYASYPNLSIDGAILEKSDGVYVMDCDFGWADLGTWHSIYECMSKGDGDNVVIDTEVMFEDSRNNVVKLPKGQLAIINGLDGYIVAEEDGVLLICKKGDSSALVRKYVSKVQMEKGQQFV